MDLVSGAAPPLSAANATMLTATMASVINTVNPFAPFNNIPDCDIFKQYNQAFDFIIIGGGTEGCILAARLSENPNWSIALLEEGDEPGSAGVTPGQVYLTPHSQIAANLYAEKFDDDVTSTAQKDGRVYFDLGTGLGGTSLLDHMIYVRGKTEDYDAWNSPNFSSDKVFKTFKSKIENTRDNNLSKDFIDKYMGTSGTTVLTGHDEGGSYFKVKEQSLLEFVQKLNLAKVIESHNHPTEYGIATLQFTANKTRETPYLTYLVPAAKRPNLCVSKNTLVRKIVFGTNNVATGVDLTKNKKQITLTVKKEVIISAGPIRTPQVLLLSGIGDKDHLQSFNIPNIINLPAVGKNLLDHSFAVFASTVPDSSLPIQELTNTLSSQSTLPVPTISAYTLLDQDTKPTFQQCPIYLEKDSPVALVLCDQVFNYNAKFCSSIISKEQDFMFTLLINVHPCSTGSVALRSSDPSDSPIINAGYYSCDNDLSKMVKSIDAVYSRSKTNQYSFIKPNIPQCETYTFPSNEYWECYVKATVGTNTQLAGTAALGSVVDDDLKIIGSPNVRVVGSSIMPKHCACEFPAPLLAIAEIASDLIKSSY